MIGDTAEVGRLGSDVLLDSKRLAGARVGVVCNHASIDARFSVRIVNATSPLIAPTWRGPLPTMMGGRKPVQERIRRLIHAPVVGELIYRLNVSRPVVRMTVPMGSCASRVCQGRAPRQRRGRRRSVA